MCLFVLAMQHIIRTKKGERVIEYNRGIAGGIRGIRVITARDLVEVTATYEPCGLPTRYVT